MKAFAKLLLSLCLIISTCGTLKAQDDYDPCYSCVLFIRDAADELVRQYRNDITQITPFLGPNSPSYLGGSGGSNWLEIASNVAGMWEVAKGLSNINSGLGVLAVAGLVNNLVGAASSYWPQIEGLREGYYSALNTIDYETCECFKRNNCANGC